MKNQEKTEYQKYLEELNDPNYSGGSWALPENPTPLEQAKYEICQKVIRHKRNSQLTTEKLAQKIQLSKAETEDILYCRIDYFTSNKIITCWELISNTKVIQKSHFPLHSKLSIKPHLWIS